MRFSVGIERKVKCVFRPIVGDDADVLTLGRFQYAKGIAALVACCVRRLQQTPLNRRLVGGVVSRKLLTHVLDRVIGPEKNIP